MVLFVVVLFLVSGVLAGRGGDFARMELREGMRNARILKDFLDVDRVCVYDSSGWPDEIVVYCTYIRGKSFVHCETDGKYAVISVANKVFKNINEFKQFTNMTLPNDQYGLYV